MIIYNWAKALLIDLGVKPLMAENLNLFINFAICISLGLLLDYFLQRMLASLSRFITDRTRFKFNYFLIQNRAYLYLTHFVPLYLFVISIDVIFKKYSYWLNFWSKMAHVVTLILLVCVFRSIILATKDYLKTKSRYSDKPLDNQAQVFTTALWVVSIIYIVLTLFNTDFKRLVTTFGALSAIGLLVFKDTILGFVASIQVTFNDTVRIGDWITNEKYAADGNVMEINLVTVKVQNFDNTITTVPTYSLISDSFKNWRGMYNSPGRRIKRAIFIKESTVRFVSDADLQKYREYEIITAFIDHRQRDINLYNQNHNINKSIALNGRNMTNLGLLRKYMTQYLNNHTGINKDMTLMVRQLQPTEKGIPLEVYAFTKDKVWGNHEAIAADLFDHFIAAVPYFDLEIYELPSSLDRPSQTN